ncbi:2Fe-2S iron-sulfur cluster-binding protein [Heliorestis convoluta]|uniref:Proton-translocating NADH-ubiquinone oxidoreductase 75 kd, chain G n=1 Tax=Heliorestis convoluta TaxID=356322 RepID=A0A5Q2N2U7_9FIRM|nr:Proton-translocating NADH-ubiquinone oxidoreductase 75 kd, chain G [Heliorestis convoluta]
MQKRNKNRLLTVSEEDYEGAKTMEKHGSHRNSTKDTHSKATEKVKLQIDGIDVEVDKGLSLLEAARSIGINVPSLCYLKEINEIGACRVCLVEIEGQRTLQAACVYPSTEGWWCAPIHHGFARHGKER